MPDLRASKNTHVNNLAPLPGRADAAQQPVGGLWPAARRHHAAVRLAQHGQQLGQPARPPPPRGPPGRGRTATPAAAEPARDPAAAPQVQQPGRHQRGARGAGADRLEERVAAARRGAPAGNRPVCHVVIIIIIIVVIIIIIVVVVIIVSEEGGVENPTAFLHKDSI